MSNRGDGGKSPIESLDTKEVFDKCLEFHLSEDVFISSKLKEFLLVNCC